MANAKRVDKENDKLTESILNLTLEIISLLTGEEYKVVKKTSGDHVKPSSHLSGRWSLGPIIDPPPSSLERNNDIKILEVTQKIIELLTGEVPMRCQDVTVYFSMEEWEYIEGHKDLYKDVMMENRPPLTSQDGSSNSNPPERCPRPLYSRDSTQEHQEIPQEDYSISEDDQVDEAEDFSENKNHDDSVISEDFEEDVTVIKVEDLYDEEMRDDEMCAVKGIPPEIRTDRRYKRCKKKKLPFITPDGKIKDYDMAADYTVVNPTSWNLHQGWHSAIEPFPPFTYEGRLTAPLSHRVPEGEGEAFLCMECGKCFNKQSSLDRHRQLMHIWEKPYSCSECGKRFGHKISLVRHQRIHNNENTFSCPLCGRCFAQKSHLVEHERQHTGEKPYACTECGKRFAVKRALVSHESTHAGQKQFCCPECGKCFSRRAYLFSHQRVHLKHKMV
ncbi:uncharacterized protein [Aquarana catesbeiana]|uniref:uncharacterized protein isoform X2 n=1 Tax=Aquarana catesbeiana TaxID=8400 RepID=UPI003CCA26AF